jgi:virulence-associated protein VagC
MTEQVMNTDALQAYLAATIRAKRVRVRENNSVVTVEPVAEKTSEFNNLSSRQKKAVREFIQSVNAATDEPLDEEFDEIIHQRINITRDIAL